MLVKAEGMHDSYRREYPEKTARYFVDLVDCCADFGGRSIIVGSPYQRNLMKGVSYEQRGNGPPTCSKTASSMPPSAMW